MGKADKTRGPRKPVALDLFCGVGGMSLGFEQAGLNVVAGVDFDSVNIESYKINFPKNKAVLGDISKLSGIDIRKMAGLGPKKIDVLFGGPPCGGFSLIGKRIDSDPRNKLLFDFARLISELQPNYVVFENVKGLVVGKTKKKFEKFVGIVKASGYEVVEPIRVLNAKDFGVPQDRQRVILLAYKKGCRPLRYPSPMPKRITVGEAIGDLPKIEGLDYLFDTNIYKGDLKPTSSDYAMRLRGQKKDRTNKSYKRRFIRTELTGFKRTKHSKETIRRFSGTKPGTAESISRLFRLPMDGLSRTLRAGADENHGSYTAPRPIHPKYPRCVTIREGARLHSFPDWFQFDETIWHGFRQIGNSVPPNLAKAIGLSLLDVMEGKKNGR